MGGLYPDLLRDSLLVLGLTLYPKIIWLLMALAWGTIRLLTKVNWNDASGEMEWRFGQFMAVMLSTFPLWSIYTRLQGMVCSYSFSVIY